MAARVLVVEDESDIQLLMTFLLRQSGSGVIARENGLEALHFL
jgi:CheY-like chemotaxis protein